MKTSSSFFWMITFSTNWFNWQWQPLNDGISFQTNLCICRFSTKRDSHSLNTLEFFEITIQRIDNTLPEMTENSAGQRPTRTLKSIQRNHNNAWGQQRVFVKYRYMHFPLIANND